MWCGCGRWILERGYCVVLVRALGGDGGEKGGGGGWRLELRGSLSRFKRERESVGSFLKYLLEHCAFGASLNCIVLEFFLWFVNLIWCHSMARPRS